MATYNGEKYLKEQIDSILIQLNDDDELIISDDGSTDKTYEFISNIKDYRIKFFQNTSKEKFRHGQFISNFENALKQAKGDLIFFADQDDVWLSNKIKSMSEALSSVDLVISDCTIVDKNLVTLHDSYFEYNHSDFDLFKSFSRNPYLGCTMGFRKELLEYALPFPIEISAHDSWLGVIAEFFGKVGSIEEKTILYRRHDLNLMNTENRIEKSTVEKAEVAIYMLQQALKRHNSLKSKTLN